jgi:hypothetical protein
MKNYLKFILILLSVLVSGCIDSPEEKKIKEQLYGKWTLDGISVLEFKKGDDFSQTNIRFNVFEEKYNKTTSKEVKLSEGSFSANNGQLKKRHSKHDGVGQGRNQELRESCYLGEITASTFTCGPNTWKRVID